MTDIAVDLKSQAEASIDANSGYNDPQSATRLTRIPQLPDPEAALHQSTTQGGSRPVPSDIYEDVETRDDGSKTGPGVDDPVDAARKAAAAGESGDDGPAKLTGQALDERAAELDIEGRSDMTADEKRAAIAEAEAQQ